MLEFYEYSTEIFPALLVATKLNLALTAICLALGITLGLALGLVRVYGNRLFYVFATGYIEFIRGTPLMVQLFLIYYGLPDVGIVLTPLVTAGLAFALNTAAYQAEYFRGAIQSIEAGQMIAARAVGMSRSQAIRSIILPQMVRIVIPPWSNEFILMFKLTSLSYLVGIPEIVCTANQIGFESYRYLEVYVVTAIIFVAYVLIFTKILDFVEKTLRVPGLGHEARHEGQAA